MPLKPLKPFFSYYGAKYRIAKRYPDPTHDTIIEPFAGSAAYSAHWHDRKVILYDLNPIICGVWDYLIKTGEEEISRLPLVHPGEHVDALCIPQEARWLIGFWLNKGSASPCKSPSQWMASGRYPRQFWGEAIKERLRGQLKFIRHWEVRCQAYSEIANIPATWFVDPPYQVAGKHYPFNGIDYSHLGQWCRLRTGQVIVCENSGAGWLPFGGLVSAKGMAGSRRTGKSSEVLWVGNN